ncbi:MAG TPA: hypothetical protein PLF78_08605, partial [Caulobacter sp.]|nr:hypothetical protein [Caulobacter sp.]
MTKRIGGVAVLAASALLLAGCSTVGDAAGRLNPFKKEEPKEVAGEGRRISIVAFDQRVEAAEGLKGMDFFLPTATALATPKS